jgi:hypothetical protein
VTEPKLACTSSKIRALVDVLSPQRPGFATESVHVGFVVDKVALGKVFFRVLQLSPVNIIPPWLTMFIYHQGMNNRPVGGRSSETSSHPIDVNINNKMEVTIKLK